MHSATSADGEAVLRPHSPASIQLSCSHLQFVGLQPDLPTLQVIGMGSEAYRLVHNYRTGRILAVFRRSFYVQCNHEVFCVGLASLGQGPLHVLLKSGNNHLPAQLTNGLLVSLGCHLPSYSRDLAGDSVDIIAHQNRTLYAGKVSTTGTSERLLKQRLPVLAMTSPIERQGFSWIIDDTQWHGQNRHGQNRLAKPSDMQSDALQAGLRNQCLPALICLYQWLQKHANRPAEQNLNTSETPCNDITHNLADSPDANDLTASSDAMSSTLPTLLGAGPGLTPAGDDLLAGVILALRRIGHVDKADYIWQIIEPLLSVRTNVISSAHLRQAARGQCSERMLHLLELVFADTDHNQADDVQKIAGQIRMVADGLGASSGWDTLAGMCLVLRAL